MSDKKPVDFFFDIKKNKDLAPTQKFSLQSIGDWQEESDSIAEYANAVAEPELKVDYSDFSNHCFFDSAVSKFDIAKARILQSYPFNGSTKEKVVYELSGSPYERHIFNSWPKYAGLFNGASGSFITGSDYENKLYIGSSSFGVSLWTSAKLASITGSHCLVQVMSANLTTMKAFGFVLQFTGTTDPHVKFLLNSGSSQTSISAAFTPYVASADQEKFHNISAFYDYKKTMFIAIDGNIVKQQTVATFKPFEHGPMNIFIGSGSTYGSSLGSPATHMFQPNYSNKIDDVVLYSTASLDVLRRTYKKGINAESFVKLHYSFNESVTGIDAIDSTVIDYSKSGIHANIVNYNSSFTRLSSSTVSSADPKLLEFEKGEPILYSFNSSVVAFTGALAVSASEYDKNNTSIISNMVPQGLLEEDQSSESLLQSFLLSMARYLDTIKIQIDQFDNIKHSTYDEYGEAPDIVMPYIARYFGISSVESFSNVNPLQFYFGDKITGNSGSTTSVEEIRAQFWKRLLNNAPYILKSKGKKSSVESLLNVFGINKNVIRIKEYGQPVLTSIDDTRIHTQKHKHFLGMGVTGSFTGSVFSINPLTASNYLGTNYTFEISTQLPHSGASYTSVVDNIKLSGTIASAYVGTGVTFDKGFILGWIRSGTTSEYGKLFLKSADLGLQFTSSQLKIFNEKINTIAFGLSQSYPFISVKTLDGDEFEINYKITSSVQFTNAFTGSGVAGQYSAHIGLSSSYNDSLVNDFKLAQGYYGEFRFWSKVLTDNELESHAYDIRSVSLDDPMQISSSLRMHFPLDDNISADSSGVITGSQDLSRNGGVGVGKFFRANSNSYKSLLADYNFLSPSLDLKWTDNKIRIVNSSKILDKDLANDTNEVSLEFNLVDALNEDISKIFATLDDFNNAVGAPINKYRDEYSDLEKYRRIYFQRLGDSLNFTKFFKLFTWFDKKISNAIKQLLPVRTQFIGGENVVESHFLERNKYGYKYPIFRTPATIPEAQFVASASVDSTNQRVISDDNSVLRGPYVDELNENKWKKFRVKERNSSVAIDLEAQAGHNFISQFNDKDDYVPENDLYVPMIVSGSLVTSGSTQVPSSGSLSLNVFHGGKEKLVAAGKLGIRTYRDAVNYSSQYNAVLLSSSDYGNSWKVIDIYNSYSGSFTGSVLYSSHSVSSCCFYDKENEHIYYGGISYPYDANIGNEIEIFLRRKTNSGVETVFSDKKKFSNEEASSVYVYPRTHFIHGVASVVKGYNGGIYMFGALSSSAVIYKSTTGNSGTFSKIYEKSFDYSIYSKTSITTIIRNAFLNAYYDPSDQCIYCCGKENNTKIGRSEDPAATVYKIDKNDNVSKIYEKSAFALDSEYLSVNHLFSCICVFGDYVIVGGQTEDKKASLTILTKDGSFVSKKDFIVRSQLTSYFRSDTSSVSSLYLTDRGLFVFVSASGFASYGVNYDGYFGSIYYTNNLKDFFEIKRSPHNSAQIYSFNGNKSFVSGSLLLTSDNNITEGNLTTGFNYLFNLQNFNLNRGRANIDAGQRNERRTNNINYADPFFVKGIEGCYVDVNLKYFSGSWRKISLDTSNSGTYYTDMVGCNGVDGVSSYLEEYYCNIVHDFSITNSQLSGYAHDYTIDKTNFMIDRDSSKYIANIYNFSLPKHDLRFIFEVSCSSATGGFSVADISCSLFFSSAISANKLTVWPLSVNKQLQSAGNGWRRYETKLMDEYGNLIFPTIEYGSPFLYLSCSNTYSFRNVSFKWKEQLSAEGRQWLEKIDNQNIELHNLNVSVMKKVD